MAFGKKRLPPEKLAQIADNREDLYVHKTEVKMLKVLGPDTPLGHEALIKATEETMASEAKPYVCTKCNQAKDDVGVALTGTCSTCWAKNAALA